VLHKFIIGSLDQHKGFWVHILVSDALEEPLLVPKGPFSEQFLKVLFPNGLNGQISWILHALSINAFEHLFLKV